MRGPARARLRRRAAACAAAGALALVACEREPAGVVTVPAHGDAMKTTADLRAERRAYDGAPPVIPHPAFGAACVSCHTLEGMAVEGVGFAPPAPHGETRGMRAAARCEQCHVRRRVDEVWVASTFAGLRQDLRRGRRLHELAPPVIPHAVFMRESCTACHTGPAAREEIRTSHPERVRCEQCHVERRTTATFASEAVPAPAG